LRRPSELMGFQPEEWSRRRKKFCRNNEERITLCRQAHPPTNLAKRWGIRNWFHRGLRLLFVVGDKIGTRRRRQHDQKRNQSVFASCWSLGGL
jgi:hypothetical protein